LTGPWEGTLSQLPIEVEIDVLGVEDHAKTAMVIRHNQRRWFRSGSFVGGDVLGVAGKE
jgi:uncharacterized protein (DUF2236 family)